MTFIELFLLLFLILCSISVAIVKNLTVVVIIYSAFSLIASILWIILAAPDLAITEAAVGAGISTVLFLLVLKNVGEYEKRDKNDQRKR